MANVWLAKLVGVMGNLFGIGGTGGIKIKNDSGVGAARNAADNDYVKFRAARIPASGENINDLVTLLDAQGRCPNITFAFDGATPPSGGANTKKFGFCHTTGGSYTAGEVVYDDGASLLKMPSSVCGLITTGLAISGTISLINNGLYALQGGTWTLKGDGGSSFTGLVKSIEVTYTYSDATKSSSTSIPDGAKVLCTRNLVETAFDNLATLEVVVDGSSDETLLATTDTDQETVGEYQSDETHVISSSTEGVVKLTIANSPTAGAGRVIVEYVTPLS